MRRTILTLAAAVLVTAMLASGQTATGVITGNIRDASGAIIPGARVMIENTKTGVKQTTQASSQAAFCSPTFPPAPTG